MDAQKMKETIERMMKEDPPKLFDMLYSMLMASATKGLAGVNGTIDAISALVYDKKEQFMKVLLRGLVEGAQSTPADFKPIITIVFVLFGLKQHEKCLLRPVIWEAGGMSALLKAFEALSAEALRQPHNLSIIDTWHQCFLIMLASPTTSHGRDQLTQALQGGFLRKFVTCQPRIAPPPALGLSIKITECLTMTSRFLVYPSILAAAELEIEGISRADHQKMVEGSMGKEWRAFLRYFVERLVFKCYNDFYDSRPGKGKDNFCDQCNLKANDGLKKCGGCRMAFYCSKACQTAAWKNHRSECNRLKSENGSEGIESNASKVPAVPPPKELEFMLRSAKADVDRHQASLHILASQNYPNVAYNSLAVLVDYCEFPPVLDVYPFAAFKAAAERFPNPRAERSVKKILLSNGKLAGLELHIPNNGKRMSVHESYSPSSPGQGNRPAQPGLYRTQYMDARGSPLSASKDDVDELMLSSGFNADLLLETDISVSEARKRALYACYNLFGQDAMDDMSEGLGLD